MLAKKVETLAKAMDVEAKKMRREVAVMWKEVAAMRVDKGQEDSQSIRLSSITNGSSNTAQMLSGRFHIIYYELYTKIISNKYVTLFTHFDLLQSVWTNWDDKEHTTITS